jgi:hypothetical protein
MFCFSDLVGDNAVANAGNSDQLQARELVEKKVARRQQGDQEYFEANGYRSLLASFSLLPCLQWDVLALFSLLRCLQPCLVLSASLFAALPRSLCFVVCSLASFSLLRLQRDVLASLSLLGLQRYVLASRSLLRLQRDVGHASPALLAIIFISLALILLEASPTRISVFSNFLKLMLFDLPRKRIYSFCLSFKTFAI